MMPPRIKENLLIDRGGLRPFATREGPYPHLRWGLHPFLASRNQRRSAIGDLVRLLPENYCAATLRGTLQPY